MPLSSDRPAALPGGHPVGLTIDRLEKPSGRIP